MYNRYIPDENGTFHHTIVDDAPPPMPAPAPAAPPPPPMPQMPPMAPMSGLSGGLLNLFGGRLDLGDVMLLLILLLMINDCDQADLPSLLIVAAVYLLTN